MRPAFLAWFALLCFTYAMNHEPEPEGYTVADATALSQLIQKSGQEPSPGASRRDIAELFGREDVQ